MKKDNKPKKLDIKEKDHFADANKKVKKPIVSDCQGNHFPKPASYRSTNPFNI